MSDEAQLPRVWTLEPRKGMEDLPVVKLHADGTYGPSIQFGEDPLVVEVEPVADLLERLLDIEDGESLRQGGDLRIMSTEKVRERIRDIGGRLVAKHGEALEILANHYPDAPQP